MCGLMATTAALLIAYVICGCQQHTKWGSDQNCVLASQMQGQECCDIYSCGSMLLFATTETTGDCFNG